MPLCLREESDMEIIRSAECWVLAHGYKIGVKECDHLLYSGRYSLIKNISGSFAD